MADLPGTHVFTGERSQQGYRLSKLAVTLTKPANREAFLKRTRMPICQELTIDHGILSILPYGKAVS